MTTRRDFLKGLGVTAGVAALPMSDAEPLSQEPPQELWESYPFAHREPFPPHGELLEDWWFHYQDGHGTIGRYNQRMWSVAEFYRAIEDELDNLRWEHYESPFYRRTAQWIELKESWEFEADDSAFHLYDGMVNGYVNICTVGGVPDDAVLHISVNGIEVPRHWSPGHIDIQIKKTWAGEGAVRVYAKEPYHPPAGYLIPGTDFPLASATWDVTYKIDFSGQSWVFPLFLMRAIEL